MAEPAAPPPPPFAFAALPWHAPLLARWRDASQQGTRPQATLLAGPPGSGKAWLAQVLVAEALCERPVNGPCRQCSSCHKLAQGLHPDLLWLQREVDEKTGRRRRDIQVVQVRRLIERLHLSTHYARGRFAVIEPVEALNVTSTNALLKTLEEPAAGTHLILISHRPQALLATLRSRCAIWRCPAPSPDQGRAWLLQQGIDPAPVPWALAAPLHVKEWADAEQLSVFARWDDNWRAVAAGRMAPLAAVAEVGKDEAGAFVRWLTRWCHRSMTLAAEQDQSERLRALDALLDDVMAAPAQLAGNVQPGLLLESLAIGWWRATLPLRRG